MDLEAVRGLQVTFSGTTCRARGNSFGSVGKMIFTAPPDAGTRATDCGRCRGAQHRHLLARREAAGYVSIPSPFVSCTASPPDVGTFHTWRRSMSPMLLQ